MTSQYIEGGNFPTGALVQRSGPRHEGRHTRSRRYYLSAEQFSLWILLISFYLQRFALPAASTLKISVATPLGLMLVIWGLMCGSLAFDKRRVALMLGLIAVAIMAYNFQVNMPLALAPRRSLVSGAYWLAVTGFVVIRFVEPMDEQRFFRLVNAVLVSIAIAGLVQFVAQVVGIRIFKFSGILPGAILIEEQFNVAAPLAFGLMRSNGFFLVEPSTFSQFMATGIIIEQLYFRRPLILGLLFAGLLASASGTGWLVLLTFVVTVALANGKSGLILAVVTALLIGMIVGVLALFLPSVTNSFLLRIHEFSLSGTSGNERFVTPFMLLSDVLETSTRTFVTGIGPGASEAVGVPYKYGVNAPVKVLLEYGIFGLFLYLMLFLTASRTSRQAALVVPMLFLFLFSGGNQLFSPILFPVLLLITVAKLK